MTIGWKFKIYVGGVNKMSEKKIKLFKFKIHENTLMPTCESVINNFLASDRELVDIKVSSVNENLLIYTVIYKEWEG